jgi:hypothetical protein
MAAKIMHKKFVSNGAFRQLVRPALSSILDLDRAQSFSLKENTVNTQKKKKCCK